MKFSKRALKRSVMNLPLPKKERILPENTGSEYKRQLKIRRYTAPIAATAAVLVLGVMAAIIVPLLQNNNAVIDDIDTSNYPVITAEQFDTYIEKGDQNVNNSSGSSVATGETTNESDDASFSPYISPMLQAKMQEYKGQQVVFRVVVWYRNLAPHSVTNAEIEKLEKEIEELEAEREALFGNPNSNLTNKEFKTKSKAITIQIEEKRGKIQNLEIAERERLIAQELENRVEYAKSIGAQNITANEHLPNNCRIMELTAEQIEVLSSVYSKIYLAASDDFYNTFYSENSDLVYND